MARYLNLNVGGYRYTLDTDDILKFPTSQLATMVGKCALDDIITIDRDGRIFHYIASYLVSGHVPRNSDGSMRLDSSTLASLKEEARYFELDQLVAECEQNCKSVNSSDFHTYLGMHKYIQDVLHKRGKGETSIKVEYTMIRTTPLLQALTDIWAPFCLTGKIFGQSMQRNPQYLLKSSTIYELNMDELLVDAQTDPAQPFFHTIAARDLHYSTAESVVQTYDLEVLAPQQTITLMCNKLLIHQEGYAHDWIPALSTPSDNRHIGTLVVILNSEYTGGELEVTHGGRTEVVTGPHSWVAMYGDCLHKINPATSGTRASLVYDIHATPRPTKDSNQRLDKRKFYPTVWGSCSLNKHLARGASENTMSCVHTYIDAELKYAGTLYVALQHLYPAYLDDQLVAQPSVLCRGDRAVYDMLTQNATYEVSFQQVTVYQSAESSYDEHICTVRAHLFPDIHPITPAAMHQNTVCKAMRKGQKSKSFPTACPKLIIATRPVKECVMYYQHSAEWTGTDSLPQVAVYQVRALRVRKKSV